MPPEALYDWQAMTAALAAEEPWWTPGEAHGYAPITYGWLLGEVIRRVDGREPGEAIVARTAAPLGLDLLSAWTTASSAASPTWRGARAASATLPPSAC